MVLASCASAVPCDDTGTSTGVWPLVLQVVLVVLLVLGLRWALRHRLPRPERAPQRRARVSASGELLAVEHLRDV